ncbi:MAG: Acylphosphatase [Phycisphaerae bacterium]|nr:Acylphosphatase [Phycisphaerae bacterium]
MSAAGTPPIRLRVVFSGRVQGVGFRYTTLDLSRSHAVVGYVRNLPDRTVELEAEGDAAAVEAFVDDICASFRSHIMHVARQPLEPRRQEASFEIAF